MSQLRDNLIAAKALIDRPENWCKGCGPEGKMCASHALNFRGTEPPDAVSEALPLWWKVRQIFRGKWSILSSANIIRFNDDPATTHADIMALFDRAIEAAS